LPVQATGDTLTLLESGVKLMSSGEYAAALKQFDAAKRADPDNAQAFFLSGATFNRLGQSRNALADLNRARFFYEITDKPAHPDMDFELGWALLREKRYSEAIVALNRFDEANPGRAQTAEFLGRAYAGVGKYERADQYFTRALKLDPALEPTVRLARAAMAQQRGDTRRAQYEIYALLNQQSQDSVSRVLLERYPVVNQRAKPWGVTAGLGVGHSSNAIALGEDEPVGAEISDAEDEFLRFTASGYYRWQPDKWNITASYILQDDNYRDINEVDQTDHIVGLEAGRNLTDDTGFTARARYRYTRVDGDSLRNKTSLTPSVWHRFNERVAGDVAYTYWRTGFSTDTNTPFDDRDNTSNQVAPTVYIKFPDQDMNASIGAFATWSDADGSDFDYDELGIAASLDTALPADFSLRLYYNFSNRDYDNRNSISLFTKKRDDDLHYFSANVSKKLGKGRGKDWKLSVYGQVEYTDRDSNLDFFTYDQWLVSTGVLWSM
jgi:tetratricopeptide (TPR) repeat protein